MKRSIFFLLIFMLCAASRMPAQVSAADGGELASVSYAVPELLAGLWEGNDRLLYLPAGEKQPLSIVLKTFYGWYYDRAAEPSSSSQTAPRTINNTTKPSPESLTAQYRSLSVLYLPLFEGRTSGAWEMIIRYGKNQTAVVPVAVIGDKLYLDFAMRTRPDTQKTDGFWQRNAAASGITVDCPRLAENIWCFYTSGSSVYYVRYWKTDMEYEETDAVVQDGDVSLTVPKHVISAQNVYTCTLGRRTTVRSSDVQKRNKQDSDFTYDDTGLLCAAGPALMSRPHGADAASVDTLLKIVKTANSKKAPGPQPLFPPADVDWHYDIIRQIEAGNPIIQAVRERQREFARRLKAQLAEQELQ